MTSAVLPREGYAGYVSGDSASDTCRNAAAACGGGGEEGGKAAREISLMVI
jgi:hypothetical protein